MLNDIDRDEEQKIELVNEYQQTAALNIAAKHFAGMNDSKMDLREFTSWYDTNTIQYLIYMQKKIRPPLRFVMLSFSQSPFLQQVKSLVKFRELLKRPIFFISFEPATFDSQHFVLGILLGNNLVIINPVGITSHKEFYTILAEVKKECSEIQRIFISNTKIQKEGGSELYKESLVSCGPICVELMKYIVDIDIPTIISKLKGTPRKHADLTYTEIDITGLLPESLKEIIKINDIIHYQNYIVENIRKKHFTLLSNPLDIDLNERDRFFENCLSADEQTLISYEILNKPNDKKLKMDERYKKLMNSKDICDPSMIKNSNDPQLKTNPYTISSNNSMSSSASMSATSASQNLRDRKLYDELLAAISKAGGEEIALQSAMAESKNTDSRQQSIKAIKGKANSFGFDCHKIKEDGNCFFHAVAHQLKQIGQIPSEWNEIADNQLHIELRARAAQHIITYLPYYRHFSDAQDDDELIEKISTPGEWADELLCRALCRAMNITIVIIRHNDSNPNIIKPAEVAITIYLGYEVGLHYWSLTKNTSINLSADINSYVAATPVDDKWQAAALEAAKKMEEEKSSVINRMSKNYHQKVEEKKDGLEENKGFKSEADAAFEMGENEKAKELYVKELKETPFYYYLVNYYKQLNDIKIEPNQLEQNKNLLIKRLNTLSEKVIIPSSQLDDLIQDTVEQYHLPIADTNHGVIISLPPNASSSAAYKLSIIGEIENSLRQYVLDTLATYMKSSEYVEKKLDACEKEYENEQDRAQEEYDDQMNNFEDGDDGYDYDGPIRPSSLNMVPFDREAARNALINQIEEDIADNPQIVLEEIEVEAGLLGDMLSEHFINCDFIEDIIEKLDLSNLDEQVIIRILRRMSFNFPDCDIRKEGFLLKILKDNIKNRFIQEVHDYNFFELAETFIRSCVNSGLINLIREFNSAYTENDNLTQQKIWLKLQPFCEKILPGKNANTSTNTSKKKTRSFSQEFKKIVSNESYQEVAKKANALVKVFPHHNSETLFFPGILEQKEEYYPSFDSHLLLRPIFETLKSVAESAHKRLVEIGKAAKVEKTNVVTAMLAFVVSMDTDAKINQTGEPGVRQFICVPIQLNQKELILSLDEKDEIFNTANSFKDFIGEERQKGFDVAGRTIEISSSQADSAKETILNLLSTLDIDDAKFREIEQTITTAAITKPVKFEYLTASDIQQSTEYNHSERVLLYVLKKPEYVAEIIARLKDRFLSVKGQSKECEKGVYTIHSAALLMYSYPNSICDECTMGILALQNSHERGFLQEFIQQINHPVALPPLFRTRGYDSVNKIFDPTEFCITTIAASEEVFKKDEYAKLVEKRPEARLTCQKMPFLFFDAGINLRFKPKLNKHNRFYEFVHSKIGATKPPFNYQGHIFMSGSKQRKLKSKEVSSVQEKISQLCNSRISIEENQKVLNLK